jgi:hypothetical protein
MPKDMRVLWQIGDNAMNLLRLFLAPRGMQAQVLHD